MHRRRATLPLLLFAALCAALLAMATPACAEPVLVLLSTRSGAYADAAASLEQQLHELAPGIQVRTAEVAEGLDLSSYSVIAALGSEASRLASAAAHRPTLVHALIPRTIFRELPAAVRERSTAVFVEQPAARQIALVRLALPDWRRLAMLHSPASREQALEIEQAARAQGLEVQSAAVADKSGLYSAIQQVLAEPAVLMALPDASVFNSYTVQNILLSAYRQRSPVVGFSPAYARAGALLALHSTPRTIGAQAASLLAGVLANGRIPPPQYPIRFEVEVNSHVARSLNIGIPGAESLREQLVSREQQP